MRPATTNAAAFPNGGRFDKLARHERRRRRTRIFARRPPIAGDLPLAGIRSHAGHHGLAVPLGVDERVNGLLAALSIQGLVMAIVGAAGIMVGLRTLRPSSRDVEEFLKARDRPPRRWSGMLAAAGVVFALVALLIGILLLMFGLMIMVLAA